MDKQYWEKYYQKKLAPVEPSSFAVFVSSFFKPNQTLLEIGCGNGRDCIYFASLGLKVVAIDQSEQAIQEIKEKNCANLQVLAQDFIHNDLYQTQKFDNVYSRFTLHAITEQEQDIALKAISSCLNRGGKFFIEVRSTKDEIFGLGEEIAKNTFVYEEHSRRFIESGEFIETLKALGFAINVFEEKNGLAVYKDSDPVVIRIVAEKL